MVPCSTNRTLAVLVETPLGARSANAPFILAPRLPTRMDVKSRHHLRSDAVADIEAALADGVGIDLDGDTYELVELEGSEFDLVLVDGEPLVLYFEDEPFVTVRGANAHEPERGVVTVDAGAVSFVSDGADVMRPGIVEADEAVGAGDLVAVAEEAHGKVLAVGRALVDGDEMLGDQGKVVESIHHVGDDLYEFSI
jgi:PUA domain protein